MKYQIYAHDAEGKLLHAGLHEIYGKPTPLKCRQLESAWRRWREEHLEKNLGDYPLRDYHAPAVMYYIHEPQKRENGQAIFLNP